MGKQKIKDIERKEKGKEAEPKKKEGPKKESVKKPDRVQIIRLAETNLNGSLPIRDSIRGIRGVGFVYSNAVIKVSGLGQNKLGELSDNELKHLEDVIMNPQKFNIPAWVYNRRRDPASGEDRHLAVSQLELAIRTDINEMRKLKIYKGVRHSLGLPVRGQRTRSSFRKSGKAMGVRKKKQPAQSKKK